MIPVTVGLIAAAAFIIASTVSGGNLRLVAVTVVTAAIVVLTKTHPLIPLAVAGALGYAGLL
jgi:chromate transporter